MSAIGNALLAWKLGRSSVWFLKAHSGCSLESRSRGLGWEVTDEESRDKTVVFITVVVKEMKRSRFKIGLGYKCD